MDSLHIAKVLKCMEEYITTVHQPFNVGGAMAYCDNCRAIVLVSDNYKRHVGRGISKRKQEQCFHCDGVEVVDFIKISYKDLSNLRDVYLERAPDIIIAGIKEGLKKVNFRGDSYTLYGRDFTDIFKKWLALSEDEKRKQVLDIFKKTDELSEAERIADESVERVKNLEESLVA